MSYCARHPQVLSDIRCPECGIVVCQTCGTNPLPQIELPLYCPSCLHQQTRSGIDFLKITTRPARRKITLDKRNYTRQSSSVKVFAQAERNLFVGYCFFDQVRDCSLIDTPRQTYLLEGLTKKQVTDFSGKNVRVQGSMGRLTHIEPIPGFRWMYLRSILVKKLEKVRPHDLLPLEEVATEIDTFERLVRQDQGNPRLLVHLGYLYFKASRAVFAFRDPLLKKATEVLQRALKFNPKLAVAYDYLALIHAELGDFRNAINFCKQAIVLHPQLTSAYLGLYVSYSQLGDLIEARQALETAARLDRNSLNGKAARLLIKRRPARAVLTSVIASCKKSLRKKYGTRGFSIIDNSLNRLAEVHRECGIESRVVYLDSELDSFSYGQPLDLSRGKAVWIKTRLDLLFKSAQEAGDPIEYCVLIGGPDIIPFFELPDPTSSDQTLLSDNPYASEAETVDEIIDYLMPTRRLGRIPDEAGARSPGLLITQIENAIKFHRQNTAANWNIFSYTAQAWKRATQKVLVSFPLEDMAMKLSEPLRLNDFDVDWIEGRQCLHFNLHGSPDDCSWKGTGTPTWKVKRALEPHSLQKYKTRGAVVFAQCCYGAYILGKKKSDSIALSLLEHGARCFIGSLGIAYGVDGTKQAELEESDLVARSFWKHVRQGGRFGDALLRAREEFDEEMTRRVGGLDEDDQKTLLSFVLYGDPTLQLRHIS